jgi:hypothetical protein
MKNLVFKSIVLVSLVTTILSCGSSKSAADAARQKQDIKEKQDRLDQDKKKFEMQNNNNLK